MPLFEWAKSSHIAVIKVQHSTKPFPAFEWSYTARSCRHGLDQSVVEPLMVSFSVIMVNILRSDLPKMPLTKWHNLVQALSSGRQYEPFGVGVQIWASGG